MGKLGINKSKYCSKSSPLLLSPLSPPFCRSLSIISAWAISFLWLHQVNKKKNWRLKSIPFPHFPDKELRRRGCDLWQGHSTWWPLPWTRTLPSWHPVVFSVPHIACRSIRDYATACGLVFRSMGHELTPKPTAARGSSFHQPPLAVLTFVHHLSTGCCLYSTSPAEAQWDCPV